MNSIEIEPYNLSNLATDFNNYLSDISHLSKPTKRCYRSDALHFINWIRRYYGREELSLKAKIGRDCFNSYLRYLESSDSSVLSKNRKLSTLRIFFDFCVSVNLVTDNYARSTGNFLRNGKNMPDIFMDELGFSNEEKYDIEEFLKIANSES